MWPGHLSLILSISFQSSDDLESRVQLSQLHWTIGVVFLTILLLNFFSASLNVLKISRCPSLITFCECSILVRIWCRSAQGYFFTCITDINCVWSIVECVKFLIKLLGLMLRLGIKLLDRNYDNEITWRIPSRLFNRNYGDQISARSIFQRWFLWSILRQSSASVYCSQSKWRHLNYCWDIRIALHQIFMAVELLSSHHVNVRTSVN